MKRILLISVITIMIFSSCMPKRALVAKDNDLETLVSWMSGSFSSQEQAEADSNYFDIRLIMYPIWRDRTDGFWLYVEQAVHGYEHKPYRQRIYNIVRISPEIFESRVFEINEPLRFAEKYKTEGFLGALSPDSLIPRTGCAILLRRKCEKMFMGNTVGKLCASDLHGATHAVSEVVLTKEYMESWDRGLNDEGEQIWGPEKGPYKFMKIENY